MTAYTYYASKDNPDINRGFPVFDTQNLVSLLSSQLNLDLAPLLPTTPVDNMSTQWKQSIAPITDMLWKASNMVSGYRDAMLSGLTHHEGFLTDTGFSEDVLATALNRRDWTLDGQARVSFDTPVVTVEAGMNVGPAPHDLTILNHEIMNFMSFLVDVGQDTTLVLVPLNEPDGATEDPATGATIESVPEPETEPTIATRGISTALAVQEPILAYA